MSMFGTFTGLAPKTGFPTTHETYGPAMGESAVEHKIGMRGYDGGPYNSPFQDGRIKEPFTAPGPFNPYMYQKPRRRRLNMLSIFQVVCLPFLIFGITMYLFGFSIYNNDSKWCYLWVVFSLVLASVFGIKAFLIFKKYRKERWSVPWYLLDDDDSWFLVLGVAVLASCFVGLMCGLYIFYGYSWTYYRLSVLHNYVKIDPIAEGKAYLDSGTVQFYNDSFVDTSKAIGYKDGSVYCVAPIKLGVNATANIDFWAVGKDCCTGFPGDFQCFESLTDGFAHGGLRVVNDEEIAFFRLAVTQAMGEYKPHSELIQDNRLNSINPIFFRWMRDPTAKMNSYWDDAIWWYKIFLAFYFMAMCVTVPFFANKYWKNRLWG